MEHQRALALEPIVAEVAAVSHPLQKWRVEGLALLAVDHCSVSDPPLAGELICQPLASVHFDVVEAEDAITVSLVVAELSLVTKSILVV